MIFYGELAKYWSAVSPVQDSAEEAAGFAQLLGEARTVLELGSGGGHNAFHLKSRFQLTLSDLHEEMLAVSRALNPECEHVQGDMRHIRLERTFDAVFLHDAVDYMTTEADLLEAMRTAFLHCRPGGLALFVPDHTRESFAPSTDHGGSGDIRFLEWTHDPDPADTWAATEYVFVVRQVTSVRTLHETHRFGLFSKATWLKLLEQAGFRAEAQLERTTEDRPPRTLFIGRR